MSAISSFRVHLRVITALILSLAVVLSLGGILLSHTNTLASANHRPNSVSITQLSTDPYNNTGAEHQTEVEPDIFAFGSTIVSTFQVARFTHGGASNIGWATSNNGGMTWTNGMLPGITKTDNPSNPYDAVTDPAVTYNAKYNVWLISSLAVNFVNGTPHYLAVLVSRSSDGGQTWGNPIIVKSAIGNLDKDWIVCDNTASSPYYGNCYDQWDSGMRKIIQLSTSTDGGLTWGKSVTTANSATGQAGQPFVQPNGTVIFPIDDANAAAVLAFISTNGGKSWSRPIMVAAITAHKVAGKLRDVPFITAAMDGAGTIYVVWQDCRFEKNCSANDLVMSTSTDGIHWSHVQLIPADPVKSGVDHFLPGLAIDPSTFGSTAHLVLAFYYYPVTNCTFSTCQLEFGYTSSTDGGATWTATTNIAGPMQLGWLATTNTGWMVGDYIATAFSNGLAFPIFAVATAPDGGSQCAVNGVVCHESMFSVTSGLS
jgi:hypothetical protein